MPTYTQTDRPMQVGTALGADKFLLAGVHGHEGLSTPYEFRLDLRSTDASVDAKGLLRTPVSVTIETADAAAPRRIHGLVSRCVQLGQRDDLNAYAVDVVPWTWFLSLARNCRIFQDMSVLDIVQKVFKDAGFTDFRLACNGSYAARDYCVQYRESDLDFVSRLMEEEGIFYFFEHAADKHTLVLADVNSATPVCSAMAKARMVATRMEMHGEGVLSLLREDAVHAGKATLRDYDFEKPASDLVSSAPGTGREEIYDYPGRYSVRADGDRLTKLRIEEAEVLEQVVRGESNLRGLQAGTRFDLESHHRADTNRSYLVVEATISASAENFRAWDGSGFEYHNAFVAIPAATVYRPPRRTPRPVVAGTQTAIVVGKAGEEIWTDKYGRVKVQFHWDRTGKKDEKSSCWVRVASTWAGKGWGAIQIPRMGQEVVVAFLEGDPDRPIIIGSVYNADQQVPYALPGEGTKSVLKSRSSKGGSPSNYNEIVLEDKKGSEEIGVRAEKDLNTVVKNDETRSVGHDRTTTIKHDDKRTVSEGDDTTTIAKGNQTLEVTEGDQTTTIGQGDQTVEVKQGKQTITVAQGDQVVEVKAGKQSISVKGTQEIDIADGDQKTTLHKGKQALTLDKGNQEVTLQAGDCVIKLAKGSFKVSADLGKLQLQAMNGIELKVGQSTIVVDQKGVTIKGVKIGIEADLAVQIKGLKTDVMGDGMHKAAGGITMLG